MINPMTSRQIVVGVDGSKHALRAAIWARDECLHGSATLRLLYVIASEADDLEVKLDAARLTLQAAFAAVEAIGEPVRIESEIARGDSAAALIEASRSAQMVCLGARGMHDSAPGRRGGTAAAVSESAFCPVVVIRDRHPHRRHLSGRRVVAVLDDSPVSREVWRTALSAARRRHAPILALTCWPARTSRRHAAKHGLGLREEVDGHLEETRAGAVGVEVSVLPLPPDVTEFLRQTSGVDQLVIVGKNNPFLIAELVGPQGRSRLRKTNCSVMVFREQQDAPPSGMPLAEASGDLVPELVR